MHSKLANGGSWQNGTMEDDTKILRGYWWLPEAPDERMPGTLRITHDGRCELELIGGLNLSIGRSTLREENSGERPISRAPHIHGVSEGKPVTLLECFISKQMGFGSLGKGHQNLHVQEALVGAHTAADEAAFRQAIVTVENLSSWLALNDALASSGGSGDNTVSLRDFSPQTCEIEGWSITARGLAQPFSAKYERARLTVQSEVEGYLVLTPSEPSRIREFHALVLELMDLLTLASGTASGQISLTLIHKDPIVQQLPGDARQTEWENRVESHGARIHTATPSADAAHDWEFQFTCRDVAFSDVVPAWISLRRRANEACNVFFGLFYAPPRYTEVRLLLVAIAAEAMHEALYPEELELSKEAFTRIRENLLKSLDNPDELKWAKSKLRNAPSFFERLKSLASKPPSADISEVTDDTDEWARRLKNARNNLAHTGNETSEEQLFELAEITTSILALVLLTELGVISKAHT